MPNSANIAEAKKMAAGPYGDKMSKFPLLFAKAVFYAPRPSPRSPGKVNSGTASLMDFGGGPLAITCAHVIDVYRSRRAAEPNLVFQIGNLELDPVAQLIDEDARIDCATIRLTREQASIITSDGEIGSCFFEPRSWPPPRLKVDDYVCFGGFPSSLRTVASFDEISFASWSSGGSRVASVSEVQFVSAFEREYWVASFGEEHHMDLQALGGLSGGPAFIHRGLYWDFVGIVTQYHENYDAMLFAAAERIRIDGTIDRPPT